MYRIFTWKLSTASIRCFIIFQQYTQYNDTTACVNWPIVIKLCVKLIYKFSLIKKKKLQKWSKILKILTFAFYLNVYIVFQRDKLCADNDNVMI